MEAHDYGEAWREMSKFTNRLNFKTTSRQQIEDNKGKTLFLKVLMLIIKT
jgi:hypothetical protein